MSTPLHRLNNGGYIRAVNYLPERLFRPSISWQFDCQSPGIPARAASRLLLDFDRQRLHGTIREIMVERGGSSKFHTIHGKQEH
jgi:hypothetical protein